MEIAERYGKGSSGVSISVSIIRRESRTDRRLVEDLELLGEYPDVSTWPRSFKTVIT